MRRLALLIALVVSATAASAQAPCVTGTVSSYLVAGYSCTVGGLTFDGFNLVNSRKFPQFSHQKELGDDVDRAISVFDRGAAADYLADLFVLTPVTPDANDAGFILSFPSALFTTTGLGGFGNITDQGFLDAEEYLISIIFAFHVDAGIGSQINGGSESLANGLLMLDGSDPESPPVYAGAVGDLTVSDLDGNRGDWGESKAIGTFMDDEQSGTPYSATAQDLDGNIFKNIQFGTGGTIYGTYQPDDGTSLLHYTTPSDTVTPEPGVLFLLAPGLVMLGVITRRRTAAAL